MRLDIVLVDHFALESRAKAQALIMKGDVHLGTQVLTKAGTFIKEAQIPLITIKNRSPYVGFGAYKLLKAIKEFNLTLKEIIALDVGSSTGGFTQVLLEQGAQIVYALDVGENQLDYKLRQDSRVISYEKTNIKALEPSYFVKGTPSFFTVDVSFISLKLVFPVLKALQLVKGVVLIKPQFEVGREIEGFKGFVKKEEDIQKAICKVKGYAKESGFILSQITMSPVQHKDKNQEYLALVEKEGHSPL